MMEGVYSMMMAISHCLVDVSFLALSLGKLFKSVSTNGTNRIQSPPRPPTHSCWTYHPTQQLAFSNSPWKSVSCLSKRSCLLCVPVNWHLEFGREPRRLTTLTHPQMLQHQPKDLCPHQHQHLLHQSHRRYHLLNFLHLCQLHQKKSTTMKSPQYTHSPELKMQHMPHQPPTTLLQNQSQHRQRNQMCHLGPPLRSTTPKWLLPSMHVQWIHRSPSHSAVAVAGGEESCTRSDKQLTNCQNGGTAGPSQAKPA